MKRTVENPSINLFLIDQKVLPVVPFRWEGGGGIYNHGKACLPRVSYPTQDNTIRHDHAMLGME